MATQARQQTTGWLGWVYFAGVMLITIGIFQCIIGLAALLNDTYFTQLGGNLIVLNLTTWGWIHLIYGLIMLVAGTSLFNGHGWARIVGVMLATGNFILQFAFVSVYPIWSIIIMIIDLMVIYAITVHGGEARIES